MAIPKSKICPCGRNKTYKGCCGEIHTDNKIAVCAEDLMRSRYTAFTLGLGEYLNKSHHINTRNESEKESIEEWAKSVKWIALEIINCTFGSEIDDKGTVEFKAHFKQGLFKKVIHENSTFEKVEGKWYYLGSI
tara:strand:- start:1347 stop:1748 length:402 start_codon:yes stop_codon:yes gene_type:complete